MATMSKIFSLASVSEMSKTNWILIVKSQVKFSAKDIKLITNCTVLTCNGANGAYKALKVSVASEKKDFWFTLDNKSAKSWEHMDIVDPKRIRVYQLQNIEHPEQTITRARILSEE